jgi:succinate dehydrogenase (ubiquinone) cytochrome b560 subunit
MISLFKPRFCPQIKSFSLVKRFKSQLPEAESRKPTLEIDPFERSKILNRPISPHLTIYAPQMTWILSIGHRMTGAGLALGMYVGATAIGFGLTTPNEFADMLHSYPILFNMGKVAVSSSLVFHSLNGIRHLFWDTGSFLTLKGVYNSAYVVLAGTVLGTIALMML